MEVTFITSPELFEQKFHMAAPLLLPVVEKAARGEFELVDLARLTREGRAITALVEDQGQALLALVFEFVHYPQQLAVNIMALGGSGLATVADEFWERFRAWCKSAGAQVIEASCSDAMARLLARHGFEPAYRVVRSPL